MTRANYHRAPAWLPAAIALVAFLPPPLRAQVPADSSQQMWVGQGPVMAAGPDGAVNLDQPMMMPQYGGQPYYANQMVGPGAPQYGAPQYAAPAPYGYPTAPYGAQPQVYGAQPYGAQPYGAPLVQQQPTWGQPWLTLNTDAIACGPIPPSFIHRTSVYGEFLFIRPRDAEVAYALPIDGPVAPVLGNEVPVGPVAIVDPDYDIGFRAGFNVALDKGSSFRAQYTRLRNDTDDAVTVTAPTVLRSLVSHPLGANAATDTLDASASQNIDLDLIDVDFRSLWFGCECNYAYALNYVVGAQYANLDNSFGSTYSTIGTTNVNTDIDFTGVGMRFGLEGERLWPCSGIFVYGSGITNILFGEFDANYTQTNSFNGVEAATSWTAGRIVPVLDLEFGAGWLGVNRHLRLSAGYRVSTWFNVVKTDEWIQGVQTHDFTNMDGTLTFDGVVGRAEWLF